MAGARPGRGTDLTGGESELESVPSSEMCVLGRQPGDEFEELTGAGRSLRKEEDPAGNLKQNFPRNASLSSSVQPNALTKTTGCEREIRWGKGLEGVPWVAVSRDPAASRREALTAGSGEGLGVRWTRRGHAKPCNQEVTTVRPRPPSRSLDPRSRAMYGRGPANHKA